MGEIFTPIDRQTQNQEILEIDNKKIPNLKGCITESFHTPSDHWAVQIATVVVEITLDEETDES